MMFDSFEAHKRVADDIANAYSEGYEQGKRDAQQWIPCSERLPELGERVLCQCRANIYEVLKLTVNGWYYDQNHCYMESFVIAWMPLPEPWKGEANEHNN